MKKYLLGIDIGTSACKIALFDFDGNVIAHTSGDYKVYYPFGGWAEQDPNEWWTVVCDSVSKLISLNNIDSAEIAGIGIDGQSWSAIPVDKNGNVLHNTPIWFDTRAADICGKLNQTIGEDAIFKVCGNPLQPTYASPKIIWFKENLPDIYNGTYKFLQSNSYIIYRLTGEFTQDMSQGYGFHFFNMREGTWNYELCEQMGINPELLPDIFPCHKIVGGVTKTAAELTGLAIGTPVVAGGLDAACGTLGVGVIRSGETQEHGGQSGGMSCCVDSFHADKRLILCRHVIPDHWLLQGGTVGGGSVIKWFEELFGAEERLLAKSNNTGVFYEMDKLAESINAGSDGVIFLPYMAGERSPVWDPKAKGVFYGLDFAKTKAHMIRACLESIAYSLLHNMRIAESAGVTISEFRAMGGSANSRLWTQIKADVTNKRITVPSTDTATTFGAAILAGVGTGVYGNFSDACAKTIQIKREHLPDYKNHKIYSRYYQMYLDLYESLKPMMHKNYEVID